MKNGSVTNDLAPEIKLLAEICNKHSGEILKCRKCIPGQSFNYDLCELIRPFKPDLESDVFSKMENKARKDIQADAIHNLNHLKNIASNRGERKIEEFLDSYINFLEVFFKYETQFYDLKKKRQPDKLKNKPAYKDFIYFADELNKVSETLIDS